MPDAPSTSVSFDATLGLGSNIGDKAANIQHAIELLVAAGDIDVVARSRLYRTAPWGVTDQDWFVNACVAIKTDLSARELLLRCQKVEKELGRIRQRHWGPRSIDVDILTYRNELISEADLKVPHPLIAERSFVLVPLSDIAPALHISGATVEDLLSRIDHSDVVPLE